jgi:U3 small nucleolar RNA-associated protein 22
MSDLLGFSFDLDGINFTERLFSFQINELLKNIPKHNYSKEDYAKIDLVAQQLKNIPLGKITVDGSKKIFGQVKLFREKDLNRKDWSVTIAPPSKINFVEKFCGIVDLAIQMPREMFLEKDYLDFKYLFKRAVYLESVKNYLGKCKDLQGKELQICNDVFGSSCMKPCLQISFENLKIRIIPVIHHEGYFSKLKLSSSKCCVRKDEEESSPTPFYNNVILEDMYFARNFVEYRKSLLPNVSFAESLQLIELWSARRGLIQRVAANHVDTFPEFFYYDLLLSLYKSKAVVAEMKSHIIFKELLVALSKIHIDEIIADYKNFGFTEKLIDSDFNSSFRVPASLVENLVYISSLSAEMYPEGGKSADANQFEKIKFLFFNQSMQSSQYDVVLRLKIDFTDISDDEAFARMKSSSICSRIVLILKRAFVDNKRAKSVSVAPTSMENIYHVCINLSEESVGAFSSAEFGPDINNGDNELKESSKEFRNFWGEKSQLRRYKDGTIKETVTWDSSNSMELFCEIGKYILESRLFNIQLSLPNDILANLSCSIDTIEVFGSELESNLSFGSIAKSRTDEARVACQELIQILRTLPGIPLEISAISAASPHLRGSSLIVPETIDLASIGSNEKAFSNHAIEIVVELESSSKWPDHLVAIERIKIAFLLRFSRQIEKTAHIPSVVSNEGFLDVFMKGYIFRIRLFYPKELAIRRAERDFPAFSKTQADFLNRRTLDLLEKELEVKPQLHQVLYNIAIRYPAFPLTCRLLKQWLNSLLILHYFSDELIELLVSNSFFNSAEFKIPKTLFQGFYQCLSLLATFPFSSSPLILDLKSDLTEEQRDKINFSYNNLKQKPAIFIASKLDMANSIWTREGPPKIIVDGVKRLAAAAINCMDLELAENSFSKDWIKKIFSPIRQSYQVSISLKKEVYALGRPHLQSKDSKKFKKAPISSEKLSSVFQNLVYINFCPSDKFLDDLKHLIGSKYLIFYDSLSGKDIFLCSNKSLSEQDRNRHHLDLPSLKHDISLLGSGLIHNLLVKQ